MWLLDGLRQGQRRSAIYDYFFCWNRHRGAGCDLPYVPAEIIEAEVEAWFESVQVSGEMLLRFREAVLDQIKIATRRARRSRRRYLGSASFNWRRNGGACFKRTWAERYRSNY